MAGTTLGKGTTIYTYGQPMTALHLITGGKITAAYPGGEYTLIKGDVIGICEICSEIHFLSYTVAEDAALLTYPLTNMEALGDLMQRNQDIARFFLLSSFRQLSLLQNHCSISQVNCSNYYRALITDNENYTKISNLHRLPANPLTGLEEITAYLDDESPDLWLSEYYAGMMRIYKKPQFKDLLQESAVSLGFLRKCSLDFRKTYTGADEQFRYQKSLSHFYFNNERNDLFERFTTLACKLDPGSDESTLALQTIERMIQNYGEANDCEPGMIGKRIESFHNALERMGASPETDETSEADDTLPSELIGSLGTILEYAALPTETADAFRKNVQDYKNLEDKMDTDDKANRLRRSLTDQFYTFYSAIFEKSLTAVTIPLPVRLFLYFGYVDEELAGIPNTLTLAKLAKQMTDHSASGVYTFYDWLLAVYQGRKAPSRDEFGQDYVEYLSKQKSSGNITEQEKREKENSPIEKVRFELTNLFPTTNKVTYGRITTYCPIFSASDVLKSLNDSYVTASKIAHSLAVIREVDYSAFYRESVDTEHADVLGRETIHTEYLPDVILMPNIGVRGILWQEIEGRVRNSPGRMCISIFHLEDLDSTMIRMTGDFRWELCKRVQGGRWNDISEPSLTSEYFDYIQFYRRNRDLSAEAKEKLRSGLQRAKNSFKEMFIRDYMIWILFEGKNSPRLNKVARKIFFTYCPFPDRICSTLSQNPLYSEFLDRRKIKASQQIHHIDVLIKKLQNSGIEVPESLEKERLYIAGKIG
ncbi:MAG: hypothetical protein NC417_14135 [Candidatus Gastranaerophilales bacterium]|nr:hypothetical protein [Candidatus Gastranaerophilales bacterium]